MQRKKNQWNEVKLGKGRERRSMHAAQSKARQITAAQGRVNETGQETRLEVKYFSFGTSILSVETKRNGFKDSSLE